MKLLKLLFGSFFVLVASAIGSVVGGQLRAALTGESSESNGLAHEGEEGETTIAVSPVLTNLLPGLLAGLAGKPRPVRAFLAAAAAALAFGDQVEADFLAGLRKRPGPSRPGW